MTTDSALMLNHFFRSEQRYGRTVRNGAWLLVVALVGVNVAGALGALNLIQCTGLTLCGLVLVVGLGRRYQTHQRSLEERLSALLRHIDLDWSDLGGLPLTEDQRESVHQAFSNQFSPAGHTNETYLRIRGTDEKGPAFDGDSPSIDPTMARVDSALHEGDYVGMEDELGVAEQLLEEADQKYAEEAAKQWAISEERDMDNIESGVKRLGDLVASGWFEKNAKDGAMAELLEEKDSQ